MSGLLEPAGQRLLAEADEAGEAADPLRLGTRLRRSYDPALVSAALTQVALRRRGRAKFGDQAGRMYFTPAGLEQATHPFVAAHRAWRAGSVAGSVLDLCCGVGSDLLAFVAGGLRATGVDRDPVTAGVAAANGVALRRRVTVACTDATTVKRRGHDLVFVDPARRSAAGRTFDPRAYSPPWEFVEEVLRGPAVAKVAPGIPHDSIPDHVEAEWVSLDGSLKEAALWSAGSSSIRRRATVLRSTGEEATLTDADDPGEAPTSSAGRYLYEPDDAVIRASLVTAVATQVNGWLVDPHLAYLSSDAAVATPYARAFEVLEVLPYRLKQLRAALRSRDVGAVTIKQRGITSTPESLRARLDLRGSLPATVVLARTPSGAVALLVEPLR